MWLAIIASLSISTLNFLVSIIIARIAYKKKIEQFSSMILTSMVCRFMISAGLIFGGILYFKENALAFGLSFMISTFIFIFIEIFFFQYYSKLFNLQKR